MKSPAASTRVVANERITFPEIRLIDVDGKTNLGVMAPDRAFEIARQKGTDVVVVSSTVSPPVCRLASVAEVVSKQKKDADQQAKEARSRKQKEIRLTARTGPHDLGIKADKVIAFLREGHPVRLQVSFTLSAWAKEEPGRREVFAGVVRRVAESGAGFCSSSSLTGAGPNLNGTFFPTSAPKPAADWEAVLARLATPIRPHVEDEKMSHPVPTAVAAIEGTASKATMESMLPPPELLARQLRRAPGRARPAAKADGGTAPEALADGEVNTRRAGPDNDFDEGSAALLTAGRKRTKREAKR